MKVRCLNGRRPAPWEGGVVSPPLHSMLVCLTNRMDGFSAPGIPQSGWD
jgi:hypothetical protein